MGKGWPRAQLKGFLSAGQTARQPLAASLRPGPATLATTGKENPEEAATPPVGFSLQSQAGPCTASPMSNSRRAALKATLRQAHWHFFQVTEVQTLHQHRPDFSGASSFHDKA